jgi:BioD-like phosphotransacetylase family protein
MNLQEVVERLSLEVCSGSDMLDRNVTGGYACDLLSYVMARAKEGDVWVTIQSHMNIVAVASLISLAGIVVTEGNRPDALTLEKANTEGVPILLTSLTTYEVVGRLYELGIYGAGERR